MYFVFLFFFVTIYILQNKIKLFDFGTHDKFSQVECNANMAASSSVAQNTTNPDAGTLYAGGLYNRTRISNRAKRSYRRRSSSHSSDFSSIAEEIMQERNNGSSSNSDDNNREVKSPFSLSDSLISIGHNIYGVV